MIPVNWYWRCMHRCLLSPCRLVPVGAASPLPPFLRLVTLISETSPLTFGPLFAPPPSGCAERWRSLCGTWWCCWRVSSPLDAVTARGSVRPVLCSCSSSSCNKHSTPWWVCSPCEKNTLYMLSVCVRVWFQSLQECKWRLIGSWKSTRVRIWRKTSKRVHVCTENTAV